MATVRVGLSGWDYSGWAGDFYPDGLAAARRLEYVGERFDAVEVNGSFYGLLSPSTYRKWYDATPSHFRFALKGSRFITHNKKLGDVEIPLANFFASGPLMLEEKLGPILWQVSERLRFDPGRLRAFTELLPSSTAQATALARRHDHRVDDVQLPSGPNHRIRHVMEVRNESFFTDEAVRILRDANVVLAVSHAGSWPLREEPTAGFVYLRFHGAPNTYESRYGEADVSYWCDRIRTWRNASEPHDAARITDRRPPRRKGKDVWAFFDNDAAGHAPHDALALAECVGE